MRRRSSLGLAVFLLCCVVSLTAASTFNLVLRHSQSHPLAPAARDKDPLADFIVPRPRLVRANGGAYVWPVHVRIQARTLLERKSAQPVVRFFRDHGISAAIVSSSADVRLDVGARRAPGVGLEGYAMNVSVSGVRIAANSGAGVFYALQSLEQLSAYEAGGLRTRGVIIRDWPRYAWRGMHLDVSRHFFPTRVIERFIAAAAHYKFNVFHWHLTDDRAWRIDIARYPRLARVGSCHGGSCEFYTAAQVRAVVRFARERYVTVVPEIEIPGHSEAALRAYPQYACDRGAGSNVYCPTESTFAFLQNILHEVTALFPGAYVHIGGDEVDFAPWRRSAYVRALMRREGMTTYPQVQAYITRRIQRDLQSRGKRLVGWDEILQPGTAASAIVMSWRGTALAVRSVRSGHEALVATDGPLYFDAFQGERAQEPVATGHMSTLTQVYDFNPTPDGLTAIEMQRILGGQANIWTERIATPDHLFYMAFPRELALAEILWTPSALKNWDSFLARLPNQLAWLESKGYSYRIPAPRIAITGGRINFLGVPGFVQSADARTDAARIRVVLSEPLRTAVLRYTTDGSAPSAASAAYAGPLLISVGAAAPLTISVRAFLPNGRTSSVSRCVVTRAWTRDVLARKGASRTWAALVSP